jgi:sterol 3beta-glucosyltransferase
VQVHGSEDIRFDFTSRASRDDVVNQIQAAIVRVANEAANLAAQHPRQRHRDNSMVLGEDINETVAADTPGIQTDHRQVDLPIILNVKSNRAEMRPRHFVCMTIGSRGDVQPYIVLGRELMKDGHRVTIASHPEYRDWVESFGIGYREVGGDPQALMEINIKHKMSAHRSCGALLRSNCSNR